MKGKRPATAGKIVASSRALNHASERGIFLTQSPPRRYLPLVYSLVPTPSSIAVATSCSASAGPMIGAAVTRIRSSG